jgi:hypothetical protein
MIHYLISSFLQASFCSLNWKIAAFDSVSDFFDCATALSKSPASAAF